MKSILMLMVHSWDCVLGSLLPMTHWWWRGVYYSLCVSCSVFDNVSLCISVLYYKCALPCVSPSRPLELCLGAVSVQLDMGKWVKFQAFCYIWDCYSVWDCLFLSEALSCLSCVSQSLAKPHWLWKNNLTGFNLLPPPLPSLFLLPLFLFFCAPLRLWEFILYSILNNSMPGLSVGFLSTGYWQSSISGVVLCTKPHLGRNGQFGCVWCVAFVSHVFSHDSTMAYFLL